MMCNRSWGAVSRTGRGNATTRSPQGLRCETKGRLSPPLDPRQRGEVGGEVDAVRRFNWPPFRRIGQVEYTSYHALHPSSLATGTPSRTSSYVSTKGCYLLTVVWSSTSHPYYSWWCIIVHHTYTHPPLHQWTIGQHRTIPLRVLGPRSSGRKPYVRSRQLMS